MNTYVIAEAGSTHDSNFDKALQLIEAAKTAGADACKFQFWSDWKALAKRRNAQDYVEVYKQYQVPRGWLDVLAKRCEKEDIEFLCTVYLPEDIPVIAPYVPLFKIASFEALDAKFIADHFRYKKTVLVSTGMTHMENLAWLTTLEHRIIPLHCVSAYPCPTEQANIGALARFAEQFDRYGYSDHTTSTLTGALAVARGSTVIEKHLRLSTTEIACPDFAHSLDPGRFKEYVRLIRETEQTMGSGVKEPQKCEAAMMKFRVKP